MALSLALTSLGAAAASAAPSRRLCSSGAQLQRGTPLVAPAPLVAARPSSRHAPLRVAAGLLSGGKKWWEGKHPPNVMQIGSVQQLVDAMAGAGERLVIIDFFAPWCAACKGIYPKLMKVMEERPDVLLLTVNFDENKTLVKALGVKVLPHFAFYRGAAGKLEGFSASAKRIHLIQEAIDRHTTPRCFLPTPGAPVLAEFPNVAPKSGAPAADASVPGAAPLAAPQPAAVA